MFLNSGRKEHDGKIGVVMKAQKNNHLSYQLQKHHEEKYVKYLEKRYGKQRAHLFCQHSN